MSLVDKIYENEGSFLRFLLMERVFSGDILVKEKIWDFLLDKNSTLVTPSLVTALSYFCVQPLIVFSQTFIFLFLKRIS